MNIDEIFTGYKQGGNNYIIKADSKNKWCGFSKGVIDALKQRLGLSFNIVPWGNTPVDHYFCIPFSKLEHLFTEDLMTSGELADKGLQRWTATIVNNVFMMRANSHYSVDISEFYVDASSKLAPVFGTLSNQYDVDYAIEDALANVKIRIGQSEFRSLVLSNFQSKCCLSGISEEGLLVASHIIPWSRDKSKRGDPGNGLCLFVEFDKYFDKGMISIGDDFSVIVSNRCSSFSRPLRDRLAALEGRKMASPSVTPINPAFLQYHRENIFDQF
ncbi:HNH endonuclease [Cyanobium gracile]|uniref:HNH endonuclease n=1 Tax=Cyanobium gracile UHCC 0281 TaxID=3110309 RepID=A0ABU5SXL3_9CYAN|nr:HNH endonuclease [Cyanobium gracile]MEA5443216.1 HNH endonuclease [Cyanobium gracile UHCC 0281]